MIKRKANKSKNFKIKRLLLFSKAVLMEYKIFLMLKKTAIIIGAGPAGLTAAYELLEKSNVQPIVLEMTNEIGGISRTINYKGNRIDIGGHRFFSKSERIMSWWKKIMPVQNAPAKDEKILKRKGIYEKNSKGADPEKTDKVQLVRSRLSRIFFLRKFFDYPISFSFRTVRSLGLVRVMKVGFSLAWKKICPPRKEKTLEDFLINRFGTFLYNTFFKDYTKKVWGVPCNQISPEWGAQRIKGVSIRRAIFHALRKIIAPNYSISQKNIETSLIEQFLYPKFGPGQMWEETTNLIKEKGGKIIMNCQVVKLKIENNQVSKIIAIDAQTKKYIEFESDYVFSSMPIKSLINGFDGKLPPSLRHVANGLQYRDFITVGLLCKKLKIKNESDQKTVNDIIPDNWIYIQENDVKIGRLQIFNNWSTYMVADSNNVWIGLEYFCNEGDSLWNKSDSKFIKIGIAELAKMGILNKRDIIDSTIIRQKKAYPAYFGTFDQFQGIRDFTDTIENLFLIGRNGMHRYNNQDHSMLSAMEAVENVVKGIKTKDNIWQVNAEKDYHEGK